MEGSGSGSGSGSGGGGEREVGEYEEQVWVEMQEDEDDDINCLGMFDDPDPLDLFVHEFPRTITAANGSEESSTITVTVEGFKAENGQQLNSTGLTLWRAAPILCNYLVETAADYIENKYVLELGAGLGLCGILAGALGARCVYMTDGDSPSLTRMRDNVARNVSVVPDCSTVHCKQLRWGQHLAEFKKHCDLACNEGCFDTIMGSDIIYTHDILEPLFETVDFLLKRSSSDKERNTTSGGDGSANEKKGIFLLAYARRNVKIDDVFATAIKYGFEWTVPPGAEGCFVFSRKEVE